MLKLFPIMYLLISPVVAGILITAALTVGKFDNMSMIAAAAAGFVIALPVAWFVAGKLNKFKQAM